MQRTLIGLAAVAALALAGCGGTSPTDTAAPTGGADVTVTMTDYAFALAPATIGPGPHTFHAVNTGKKPHSIVLDGPGVSGQRISGTVAPGQSGDLPVTLQPGAYDMYCPVGNHRAMGMEVKFTVGSASAPAVTGGSGGGY